MTSYQAGDEVQITPTAAVTLTTRGSFRNRSAMRWNWMIDGGDLGVELGEIWYPTAEQAVDDARRTFARGECRHGQTGFCPDCHDDER